MDTETPKELPDDETVHLFTPQEASKLLPDVKIKLREIMERKRAADSMKDEVEHFSLIGLDVPEATEKTRELDEMVRELMAKIAELEDLGVKLRDIDTGLVDFPARRFSDVVYLCWKHGESDIEYWHAANESFTGRKQLKAKIVPP